jgi:branched-subunit amino acid ABC-type transport system permease component
MFLTAAAAIALTTLTLPYVRGYGTNLSEVIVLGAYSIVAHFSSGRFADSHQIVLWPVALVLNMVLFLVIAIPVWAVFRNRAPRIASTATLCWLLFYVSMLYFLFPATSGP